MGHFFSRACWTEIPPSKGLVRAWHPALVLSFSCAIYCCGVRIAAAVVARRRMWKAGLTSAVAFKQYRRVRVIRSTKNTNERLTHVHSLAFGHDESDGAQDACVFVCTANAASKSFLGFGGSFTEASAVVFQKMSPTIQEEILRAYFDPVDGLGYELGRIPMASCDFGLGNWTCGNLIQGDMTLANFSIEHYDEAILPLYRLAEKMKGGQFVLLASPWSPPPWMKTKQFFNGDGHLLPSCAAAWALHYVKFVKALQAAGVHVWGVSVQNEPEAAQSWESCIYTAEEERDFVRDHLGPTLEKEGLSWVKIIIWDHNRDGMLERAAVAYADPVAAKYIWGVGYHWYGDARFETWPSRSEVLYEDCQQDLATFREVRARAGFANVRKVNDLRPDKHILFTEGCQELSGVPLADVLGKWKFGERYGMNIISDLNSGTEGWIDWNLYLDEKGGPNHVGNFCVAPIICDTKQDKVLYQPAYYYLGHFSKFIRPGANLLICSSSRDVLEVTAFLNVDGSIAVVIMNQSSSEESFWLKIPGAAVRTEAPPRSITTYVLDDGPLPDKLEVARGPIKTQFGTYLKATDGNPRYGHVVQTAATHSGWETFERVQSNGGACFLKTFHNSFLSIADDGRVLTSGLAGARESFVIERRSGIDVYLRTYNGRYLSVTDGVGTCVTTVGAISGDSEVFSLYC